MIFKKSYYLLFQEIFIHYEPEPAYSYYCSEWSECIFALPVSTCSLCVGNEAVRIAISLLLGHNLCEPHSCPCDGTAVDAKGLRGLSCKRSGGRSMRHQQINDLVWRALRRAEISSVKEPSGLLPRRTCFLTGLHQYRGMVAVAWLGMPLLQTFWHHLMSSSGHRKCGAGGRRQESFEVCRSVGIPYFYNLQPSKHAALLMKLGTLSCLNWVGVF